MNPFSSADAFRQVFHSGLDRLLAQPRPTPAQLVLVMANAIMLRDQALLERVHQLASPHLNPGPAAAEPGEDVQILRYALGAPDPFALIHHRTTPAGRLLQFNELRARRPKREAGAAATTIHRPFEPDKFNFTRIPDESYWQGESQGRGLSLYYNKYPFEPYHTSIVLEPTAGHEQFLRAADHQFAWNFLNGLAASQPKLILAYNSLGAYASINHLHFQMVSQGARLPLLTAADPRTAPVPVTIHTTAAATWQHLDRLQNANQPFNLAYAPGRSVVIERKFQGSYDQPAWNTGFAWYEFSGALILIDQLAYASLTDAQIEAALALAAPDAPAPATKP
jgi:hypothetical protein